MVSYKALNTPVETVLPHTLQGFRQHNRMQTRTTEKRLVLNRLKRLGQTERRQVGATKESLVSDACHGIRFSQVSYGFGNFYFGKGEVITMLCHLNIPVICICYGIVKSVFGEVLGS